MLGRSVIDDNRPTTAGFRKFVRSFVGSIRRHLFCEHTHAQSILNVTRGVLFVGDLFNQGGANIESSTLDGLCGLKKHWW
jgi:hypothetical protein